MNLKPIILSLFLSSLSMNFICAQVDELLKDIEKGSYPGYVVTIEMDTLQGNIIIPRKDHKIYQELRFLDKDGREFTFDPTQLNSFKFLDRYFIGNTKVYVDEHPFYKYMFLQQLTFGYIKVFKYENYQINGVNSNFSGMPSAHAEVVSSYTCSFGKLKPNYLTSLDELVNYIYDNKELCDRILKTKLFSKILKFNSSTSETISIIEEYNKWLIDSGNLAQKIRNDSLNSLTTHNLYYAQEKGLLQLLPEDDNVFEYFFRIIYYAYNTSGYQDYTIQSVRNKNKKLLEIGLNISTFQTLNKVGTWQFYYKSEKGQQPMIKKEVNYDIEGLPHGFSRLYDKEGNLKKEIKYVHGKRQKN